jgi:hypothetical protein
MRAPKAIKNKKCVITERHTTQEANTENSQKNYLYKK